KSTQPTHALLDAWDLLKQGVGGLCALLSHLAIRWLVRPVRAVAGEDQRLSSEYDALAVSS
ncbi:MAG: hypothetical protein AAF078_13295, partial [Planctomycetota bacterium]